MQTSVSPFIKNFVLKCGKKSVVFENLRIMTCPGNYIIVATEGIPDTVKQSLILLRPDFLKHRPLPRDNLYPRWKKTTELILNRKTKDDFKVWSKINMA